MSIAYLVHLANYSDGVLYVLAALFVVAVAILLDRLWYLRRAILRGGRMLKRVAAMGRLNVQELEMLRDMAERQPEGLLLETALHHLGGIDREAVAARMDEAIMLLAPRLDRRLWVLDTIVTLAPLLGLFGTIVGMFHAFHVLAHPGHAPAEVTGGVADALVATGCGILIAILGLAAYNMLSNQVRLIMHQLDTIKTMVLNRIDGAPVIPPERTMRTSPAAVVTASVGESCA